jgi:hypothetical protein
VPIAALRIAALLGWLAVCVPLHLLAKSFGRSKWPQRFLAGVARIAGARVRTVGEPLGGRILILANHTSWPFRPALLSAFAPAPAGVALRPVAIDYGPAAAEFGWPQGEPGRRHFLRVMGRRGTVPVTLHLLPSLSGFNDRKVLARAAHDAIAAALLPSGIAPAAV